MARLLRDELEDETSEEEIDQVDEMLRSRGLDARARAETYVKRAKDRAVETYASRRQQAIDRSRDSISRTRAEAEEENRAQTFFRFIGDLSGALRGNGPSSTTDRLRAMREARLRRSDEQEREGLGIELEQIDSEERTSDEAGRAEQIRAIFQKGGITIPPGKDRAVISVYGPAVAAQLKPRESSGEDDLETFEAKERIKARYREQPKGFDEAEYRRRKEIDRELAPPKASQPPQAAYTAGSYARRVEQAIGELDAIDYDRTALVEGGGQSLLPNVLRSRQRQQIDQAERNFVNAVLRKESGAVINEDEFTNAERQYFPRAGDSTEVVEQKRRNRLQTLENLKTESRGTFDQIRPITIPRNAAKPTPAQADAPRGEAREIKGAFKAGEIDEEEALRRLEEIEDAATR